MPRKRNLSPIRHQYSRDLKKRVIYQAFTLRKLNTTQIAIDLDMPAHVVQRVMKTWREIGEVCRDRSCFGQAPIMKNDTVKVGICILQDSSYRLSAAFPIGQVHLQCKRGSFQRSGG